MNRKSRVRAFVVVLSLVLVVSIGVLDADAQSRNRPKSRSGEVYEALELFGAVYERIARNYVDELDPEELIEAAINGMLDELDPHTALLKEELYDDLMVSTQGEFGGLGIQITVRDGFPTVISPIDGTPAARLGIQGGDQIVEIEGESTKGWRSGDAVKKLRGPKGSEVNIGIRRVGEAKILPFTIVRDTIKVESVPYAFMIEDGIGYVKISNFSRSTARELREKVEMLEQEGMEKMILDLRFNPGGLLQSAKEVSELFLDRGDLIVYTKGRLAQQNMSYYATGSQGRKWKRRPLICMVNGSSASASEILSGALQDHDVGVVMGQNSFGKGSVQTVFELTPTEALKLTTAKYFTPSGRSIHKERTREGEEVVEEELVEADDDPELSEREVYYTEMGREVLGGGGIMPDFEIEPTFLSNFAVALERDATFFHYANQFVAFHEQVALDFEVTPEMHAEFFELAQEREKLPEYFEDLELEFGQSAFEENADYVEEGIRREIVRRLYGQNEMFRVSLQRDGQVREALSVLRKADTPEELFRITEEMRRQQLAEAEAAADEEELEASVH